MQRAPSAAGVRSALAPNARITESEQPATANAATALAFTSGVPMAKPPARKRSADGRTAK